MTDILYRVIFQNKKNIFEIYAKYIDHNNFIGFVELSDIIIQNNSKFILDPIAEKLKNEFKDVNITYIPISSIIRIDQIKKKIININDKSNIKLFPLPSTEPNPNSTKK